MGKIDRKPKFNTIDNIIKYINQIPNRDRDELIKGLWTFEQLPNVGVNGENPFFAGFLGAIHPYATKPTPGKNGYYKFSDNGHVTWLNDQYVHAGDEVSVVYSLHTGIHTYTLIKIIDRTSNIVTDILTEDSDGLTTIYSLSALPMDVKSSSLYINGVYRDDFYFSHDKIILSFIPEAGSRITIKYYTVVPTSEFESDYAKLIRFERFYKSFVMSIDVITLQGDPITHHGEYIYIDAEHITIQGIADLIASNIDDQQEKLVDLRLMLSENYLKEEDIPRVAESYERPVGLRDGDTWRSSRSGITYTMYGSSFIEL